MKNLFLISALVISGLASASVSPTKIVSKTNFTNIKAICEWCVSSGGNLFCASAATCKEARAIAIRMAAQAQNPE